MSLLQDVLRTQTLDSLDKTLAAVPSSQQIETDSDDELVNVVRTIDSQGTLVSDYIISYLGLYPWNTCTISTCVPSSVESGVSKSWS